MQPENTCLVDGCERLKKSHGICNTHNERLRRNGTLKIVGLRAKFCGACGVEFKPVSGVQKRCAACTTFKCKNCGVEFRYSGAIFSKFCTKKCSDDFRRGKKWEGKRTPISQEKRQKINDAIRLRYQGEGREEYIAKISASTKAAMQRPEVQEKIRAPRGALTLEQRMALSDKLAGKMPKNMMYASSQKYPNVKRGYYDINGTTMYFRSKWEANYALYLDFLAAHGEIQKWEFEPETFMFEQIRLGTRSYTPDFKVFDKRGGFEYHEVKGYMDSKSKTKLKRFAKYYPQHKLVLIDGAVYGAIRKQAGALCGFYK